MKRGRLAESIVVFYKNEGLNNFKPWRTMSCSHPLKTENHRAFAGEMTTFGELRWKRKGTYESAGMSQ